MVKYEDWQQVRVEHSAFEKCNICLSTTSLTWDHVPPQGGIDVGPMKQETILQRLTAPPDSYHKYFISQNGVKFRTICESCNNVRLGRDYDPTLNAFAIEIGKYISSPIHMPDVIHVQVQPNRLIRSLLGHLLAAKASVEHTKPDEAMRKIVFDKNALPPCDLNIFYWIYPYPQIVVIRDVVMLAKRLHLSQIRTLNNFSGLQGAMFSILKYFPIAYLISTEAVYENLHNLNVFCSSDIDARVDIPIYLKDVRHPEWPEMVDPGNIIMGGGTSRYSSMVARPK